MRNARFAAIGTVDEPSEGADAAAGRLALLPLASIALRRLAAGLGSFCVVSFLIFVAVNAMPGDVISSVLGQDTSPERVAAMHAALHLDRPLLDRYAEWFAGFVTGDFGFSIAALAQGESVPVWGSIAVPLENSALLAGLGLLIFIPSSVALGSLAALRAGGLFDRVASALVVAISAMPEFLVGTLLVVVFFSWLDWFSPVAYLTPGQSLWSAPDALVLPVATLLAPCMAFGLRLVKAAVAESLRQEYVSMARLNGYGERRIIIRYVLRNALAPMIQALALVAKYMVGGVVVVESVFALPGIGSSLVSAVSVRDIQEIAVIAALLAAIYITINVFVDVLVAAVSPRLRTR